MVCRDEEPAEAETPGAVKTDRLAIALASARSLAPSGIPEARRSGQGFPTSGSRIPACTMSRALARPAPRMARPQMLADHASRARERAARTADMEACPRPRQNFDRSDGLPTSLAALRIAPMTSAAVFGSQEAPSPASSAANVKVVGKRPHVRDLRFAKPRRLQHGAVPGDE